MSHNIFSLILRTQSPYIQKPVEKWDSPGEFFVIEIVHRKQASRCRDNVALEFLEVI